MLKISSLALALSLALSSAAFAATSSKTFTLTNTGNGPLTLTPSAQPISGNTAEYALTGNNCASVAPGASCTMTVTFTPSANGARPAAALNFSSNGSNGPSHSIPLTGAGLAGCSAGKVVYSYTGSHQNIAVPTGCTSATIKAWGAGARGTAYAAKGGAGGFAQRTLTGLTPGAALVVVVGQGSTSNAATYGGGAAGNTYAYTGAGGGGYSGVFSSTVAHANALVVAGGGGGASGDSGSWSDGAAGGGTQGQPGWDAFYTGRPGTQTAGGAAGYSDCKGGNYSTNGTALAGGLGGGYGGGGGGGGYFGGGGGGNDCYGGYGGGGGSGYAPGGTLITGQGCNVANSADADYVSGTGNGGCTANTSGQNGRVVIIWQ